MRVGGEPLVALNHEEAGDKAETFRKFIERPVLTDIAIDWGDFDVYDLEPSTHTDLLAERPIVISGKYKGAAKGVIQLTGISGQEQYRAVYDASFATPSKTNKSLAYLWARNRIKMLDDYVQVTGEDSEDVKEVTRLGLAYNLMTNYTSFVAVDEEPTYAQDNPARKVTQPNPLPQGVSNYAIGQNSAYAANGYGADLSIQNALTELELGDWTKSLKLKKHQMNAAALGERPSITFILGSDEEDEQYFHLARKYYLNQHQTDFFVDHCQSLIEVRDYLERHLPEGSPAWGEINMVLHSNQWTGMKLSLYGTEERTTKEGLMEAIQKGSIKPLSDQVIDCNSLINIAACGLGSNEKLLATLQRALGGADDHTPNIASTSNFVYYAESDGNVSSKSLKPFYAFYRTAYRPAELHLVRQLENRYPEIQIDWLQAMRRKTPRWDGDPFHTRFNVPVDWRLVLEKEDPILKLIGQDKGVAFVKTQSSLMELLEKYEIPVDKFRWTIDQKEVNGKVQVHIKGKSTVLCILIEE